MTQDIDGEVPLGARLLTILLCIAVIAITLPPLALRADTPDPEVVALLDGLRVWAVQVDELGDLGPFAEPLPMFPASAGQLAGLDAGAVLALIRSAELDENLSDLDSLVAALEEATVTAGVGDGFSAAFSDAYYVEGETLDGEDLPIQLSFELELTRSFESRLFYDEARFEELDQVETTGGLDPVEDGAPVTVINDAFVQVETTATGAFHFVLRPTTIDDVTTYDFELVTDAPVIPDGGPVTASAPPELWPGLDVTIAVSGDDLDDGFVGRYGFTAIDGTGDATVALDLVARFVDADATGSIDVVDLLTTLPVDLYTVALDGSIDVGLDLTSDLIEAPAPVPHATLETTGTVNAAFPDDPGPYFPDAVLTVGDELAPFAMVAADDVLVALGESAIAVRAAQQAADIPLPLLAGSLSDVVDPAGILVTFTKERAEALITCGSLDASPPEGIPVSGGTAYCQAFANVEGPTDVVWSVDGHTLTTGVPSQVTATVGVSPSETVAVPADDVEGIAVTWNDGEEPKRAVHRFQTAQQLGAALDAAGFTGGVALDTIESTPTITFGLDHTHDASVDLPVRIGDAFRADARITGLIPPGRGEGWDDRAYDDTATAEVTATDVRLNAAFGVLLDDSLLASLTRDASDVEATRARYAFRQTAGQLITAGAVTAGETGIDLVGRAGYLPVAATLDMALVPSETSPTADAVAVGIGEGYAGQWIRTKELIGYIDPFDENGATAQAAERGFDAALHLRGTATLAVDDAMEPSLGVSGGLDAAWQVDGEPVAPELVVTPGADLRAEIMPFDPVPQVSGRATHVTPDPVLGLAGSTTTVTDAAADFTEAFNVTTGTVVDATLFNITDNTSCRGFEVVDAQTLACNEPLAGEPTRHDDGTPYDAGDLAQLAQNEVTPTAQWLVGDRYEVNGDPEALRGTILAALRAVAANLAASENDAFTAALPFVDLRPSDLLGGVGELAGELRLLADALADVDDVPTDVTHTVQDAVRAPAPTLDALVERLNEDLARADREVTATVRIDASSNIPNPDVPHLVVRLQIADQVETTAPMRIDVGPEIGQLVGTEPDDGGGEQALLDVVADRTATIEVALPLLLGTDPEEFLVHHDSGVAFDIAVGREAIAARATIGAVPLLVGEHDAVLLGHHTSPTVETTPTVSHRQLNDPDARFLDYDLGEGDELVLRNLTQDRDFDCTVEAIDDTTITCEQELTTVTVTAQQEVTVTLESGETTTTIIPETTETVVVPIYDDGDAYEIEDVPGFGQVALRVRASLRGDPDAGAPASPLEDYLAGLFGEVSGVPLNPPERCGVDPEGCAVLSLALLDPLETSPTVGEETTSTVGDGPLLPEGQSAIGLLTVVLTGIEVTATGSAAAGGATDTTTADITTPDDLEEILFGAPLDLSQLGAGLFFLPGMLDEALDGHAVGELVPMIGGNLDLGLDLQRRTREGLADPGRELGYELEGAVEDWRAADPDGRPSLEQAVRTALESELDAMAAGFQQADVTYTVDINCVGECINPAQIQDIDVALTVENTAAADIGLGCDDVTDDCEDVTELQPFDVGVAEVPLTMREDEVENAVDTRARYRLQLQFGMNREDGPYLDQLDSAPLLELGGRALIADRGGEECPDGDFDQHVLRWLTGTDATDSPVDQIFSQGRCVDAFVGLMPARLFDGNGSQDETRRSFTQVRVEVDLPGVPGQARQDFRTLLDRRRAALDVDAESSLNLVFTSNAGRFYDDIEDILDGMDMPLTLPQVIGTFHARYDGTRTQVFYNNLGLDPGDTVANLVGPIVAQIRDLTAPFQPVFETAVAPIPIVSDLSQLTGGGPVSILDLLEAASGNDLTMLRRLISVVQFVGALADASGDTGILPLGVGNPAFQGVLANDDATDTVDWTLNVDWSDRNAQFSYGGFSIEIDDNDDEPDEEKKPKEKQVDDGKKEKPVIGEHRAKPEKSPNKAVKSKVNRETEGKVSLDGAAITFPFLENPDEVLGMILGVDAVLVRFDAGELSANVAVSWTFGPFIVGPVAFDVGIGGSLELKGRFALGYDTRGLTRYMMGKDPIVSPFVDGLFVDDYDASGEDVDEIVLVAKINASAALSFKIIRAGLEAEVTLTIAFDLVDWNGDGRIRIEHIYQWRHDPICLFTVTGTLGFALSVFIEINLFIKKLKFSYTLWELKPPLQLFEIECELPPLVLASAAGSIPGTAHAAPHSAAVNGHVDGASGILRLHAGTMAADRQRYADEVDESFTVRQTSEIGAANRGETTGTTFDVEAFDEVQPYFVPGDDPVIFANMAGGNDTVRLDPGVDEENPDEEIRFTARSVLIGGAGRNRLQAGDGDDLILIGTGSDKNVLNGGAGDDVIWARSGTNTIDGGIGDDVIIGGPDDDRINTGPGADIVYGTGGDNVIEAGPGLRPGASDDPDVIDAGNLLVGGTGSDTISGGASTDYLFGQGVPAGTGTSLGRGGLFSGSNLDLSAVDAQRTTLRGLIDDGFDGAMARSFMNAVCTATPSTAAGGGNAMVGYGGDDFLYGGPGDDRIDGYRGDNVLCANNGDNVLEAGKRGDNELHGGPGSDRLLGGSGNDFITGGGGGGTNYLSAGGGDNVLIGGDASNLLVGAEDGEMLIAGEATVTTSDGSTPVELGRWTTAGEPEADPFERTVSGLSRDPVTNAGQTTVCTPSVAVIGGLVDLDRDGENTSADSGFLAGLRVNGGVIEDSSGPFTGFVGGYPIAAGSLDLNADGEITAADSGRAQLPAMKTVGADPLASCVIGGDGADAIFGGAGGDYLHGGFGDDFIDTGPGDNTARGGPGDDAIFGGPGGDTLHGDSGDDTIFGGPGHDLLFGGPGADWIEGGAGDDIVRGGPGDDVILGGGSGIAPHVYDEVGPGETLIEGTWYGDLADPDVPDDPGDDVLYGQDGHDYLIGDNAALVPTQTTPTVDASTPAWHGVVFDAMRDVHDIAGSDDDADARWPGGAPRYDVHLLTPDVGGDDRLFGGPGDDHLFGGPGDDHLEGGAGDDYLEGGPGDDVLFGYDPSVLEPGALVSAAFLETFSSECPHGQNVLIGGSSAVHLDIDSEDGAPSGDDVLVGGVCQDVVVGDNAEVERVVGNSWAVDDITGGHARIVSLYDLERFDPVDFTYPDAIAGDDLLVGIARPNRMYGGPGDDYIVGGMHDDYVEGGPGDDWIEGGSNASDDDLIGGGSQVRFAQSETSPTVEGVGYPSGSNWIFGQGGQNVIAGDNAVIVRADPGGDVYLATDGRFAGFDQARWVDLLDLEEALSASGLDADHVAGDVITAGTGNSIVFGQGADDWISAGEGDDYVEGGRGEDVIFGHDPLGVGVHEVTETVAMTETVLVFDDDAGTFVETTQTVSAVVLVEASVTIDAMDTLASRVEQRPSLPDSFVTLRAKAVSYGVATPTAALEDDPGDAGQNDLVGGSSTHGEPDGDDVIVGAEGADVIAGDNATILREVLRPEETTGYAHDPVRGAYYRYVEIHDLDDEADYFGDDPLNVLSGDDLILGVGGDNRLFGGPGDDYIVGGPDFDTFEGGPGDDWLEGGGGDDDLIGGSSAAKESGGEWPVGYPSGSNWIFGQGGDNVITADNAQVLRVGAETTGTVDDAPHLETDGRFLDLTAHREVILFDRDSTDTVRHGGDVISAGPGPSLIFGQSGDDWISAGDGDDYVEGGAGDDVIFGDRSLGVEVTDTVTDREIRVVGAETPTVLRRGHVGPSVPGSLLDLRVTAGELGHAIAQDDLEPNEGNHGQDDLIGGNAAAGLPAGSSIIYGDGGDDFLLGDNAAVIREVDEDQYARYDERYDASKVDLEDRTVVRQVVEFDVGALFERDGEEVVFADGRPVRRAWDASMPWGDDFLDGGSGDDTLHGQDGDDELWGSPHDDPIGVRGTSWGDHLIGGLGDDRLYGGPGNDVLIGDRGSIITRYLVGDDLEESFTRNGPPHVNFSGRSDGELLHEVDLYCKVDRDELRFFPYGSNGCGLGGSDGIGDPSDAEAIAALKSLRYSRYTYGGDDLLRGGRGDTVIYGGGGNDILQGDEGADVLFGGRGSNILYGGEGEAGESSTNPADYLREDQREHVDWLFGGRGESLLDYRPRVKEHATSIDDGWADPTLRQDPGLWFEMTRPYWHPDDVDDVTFEALRGLLDAEATRDALGNVLGVDGTAAGGFVGTAMVASPQHHQGVTWAYGGWGRKVHQMSVTSNPPDLGDRFMDWHGNFNLFTHCARHYGSDNVSRELRPQTDDVVHLMALIAGAGPSLESLRRPGTSGFDQIAFVNPRIDGSTSENTGAAFRDTQLDWGADLPGIDTIADGVGGTPGHRYDTNIACGS